MDAEERQRLGWSFGFVLIDDEAELTDGRLREEQMPGHVIPRCSNEEKVVEVANVVDAELH